MKFKLLLNCFTFGIHLFLCIVDCTFLYTPRLFIIVLAYFI